MKDFKNCKTLNDIARQEFGKANYTNREKCKKLLEENGINWKEWLETKKVKEKKYCLQCGKELDTRHQTKFCSSSCAAKYNNSRRELSEEIRVKISHSLQKKNPDFNGEFKPLTTRSRVAINDKFNGEKRYCKNCGKELKGTKIEFCNAQCQNEYKYKTYIERWKNDEENGLKGEYGLSRYIKRYLLEKHNCKCEKCGWGEENPYTHTIPLEIHHMDGDYKNNKEENLQVLCPNCHSLTDTYAGKNANRENSTKYVKKEKVKKCDNKSSIASISDFAEKRFENTHPSKETLINDFKELKSFVKVGKKYNVSDNGIRRWCEHYNLPTSKKYLLEYINRRIV